MRIINTFNKQYSIPSDLYLTMTSLMEDHASPSFSMGIYTLTFPDTVQGRNYHCGIGGSSSDFPEEKKEKRDHDSFNIFQKSKRQVFKLAIFQVVSPFFREGFMNFFQSLVSLIRLRWIRPCFLYFGFAPM